MKLPIKIPQGLTRAFGKLWLKTKNARPEIFVVSGIVCGSAAVVMTAVQTWKHKDRIEMDLDAIRPYTTDFVDIQEGDEKADDKKVVVDHEGNKRLPVKIAYKDLTKDQKKQLWARRIDLTKDVFKIYWIPATLGLSSVGLIWGGRTMLRKELSALTAAYAALSESFNRYRQKVIDEFGADKDQEFQYGYKLVDSVDSETGQVEKRPMIDKDANLSQYGFWFDEGYWDKDNNEWIWKNYKFDRSKLVNRMAVITAENNFTHELNTIGYVRLENVALFFGIDPETAHQWHNYGWVWQEGRRNVVNLGVLEGPEQLEVNKGFTDDRCSQNVCFINPNVDGYIGFINDDLKSYDFRYGKGELKKKGIRLRMMKLINQHNEEDMMDRVEMASSKKRCRARG